MSDPLRTPARIWIKTRKPWQRHRLQYWSPPNNARNEKGAIYTDSRGQYGEDLGFADDLAPRRVDNRGWYADSFQNDVIRGSVTRIRGARFTLYAPVTGCTGWDGTIHHLADAERVPRGSDEDIHQQAIRDAAATADRCAEIEAEQAREDDIKDRAEQAIKEERGNMAEARRTFGALAVELRAMPALPPAMCRTIRDRLETCRASVRASVARIRALQSNPYLIEE
jgi:hypothetical protein